jgi:alkylresorcinol/alkylpyrone synthase
MVRAYLPADVDGFLERSGLSREDVQWWVCHPGGPKVLEAIEDAMAVPREAVALTWDSLARIGNLSSASVLHVFEDTLRDRPPRPGSHGLLVAMGPGFCSELVLLRMADE